MFPSFFFENDLGGKAPRRDNLPNQGFVEISLEQLFEQYFVEFGTVVRITFHTEEGVGKLVCDSRGEDFVRHTRYCWRAEVYHRSAHWTLGEPSGFFQLATSRGTVGNTGTLKRDVA